MIPAAGGYGQGSINAGGEPGVEVRDSEPEQQFNTSSFSDKAVRAGFIRKVGKKYYTYLHHILLCIGWRGKALSAKTTIHYFLVF